MVKAVEYLSRSIFPALKSAATSRHRTRATKPAAVVPRELLPRLTCRVAGSRGRNGRGRGAVAGGWATPEPAAYDSSVDRSSPSVAQSASDVSGALTPRAAEISADIYQLIVREIPQLRGDGRVLTLLEASVGENVTTALHVMQHGIDLENVHSPVAAEEYARRLAQRGVPIAALLRAYRIGATRFQDWCLEELGRRTDNASVISAAGLRIADATATYIDTWDQ